MKKSHTIALNHADKQIIVTKSFLKEAGIIGSEAYEILVRMRQDLPDYQIVQREIAKKQGKKTYGKLTYETMADFIAVKEGKNAPAALAEFERIKNLSKIQAGSYAYVKTWFLNRYKDVFTQDEESAEADA